MDLRKKPAGITNTGEWLALARQGLSPGRAHQATLGARTAYATGYRDRKSSRRTSIDLICCTTHIFTAAHRRLDFTVPIGTL